MAECRESSSNNTSTLKQLVAGHSDSAEENKTDKAMDPMLVEDIRSDSMPASFVKVQELFVHNGVVLDVFDELVLLMHIMMLESGFVVQDNDYLGDVTADYNYWRVLEWCDKIPRTWKVNRNVYNLSYVLPTCVRSPCSLTSTISSDDLLVNCYASQVTGVNYSLLLDPALYIIKSSKANRYQNMRQLSCKFKTAISNPVKISISKHNDHKVPCLQDLPPEVMENILKYFNTKMLGNFEGTCRYFRKLSHDPSIWRTIRGAKCESFHYYKVSENAKYKFKTLMDRAQFRRHMV